MSDLIPYSDFGGSGRTIIFLHGNGFPPECYSPLLNILATQYHVIGMHSRTMWQKEVPDSILTWKIFADDLTLFIKQHQLQDAILVGHSFGALSALRTLQNDQTLRNPLIMIDPVMVSPLRLIKLYLATWKKKTTMSQKLKQAALRRKRVFSSLEEAEKTYTGKPIFRLFSQQQMKAFVEGLLRLVDGKYQLKISPEWEAKIYSTAIYKDIDIFLKIPFFKERSLVIWGTESDTFRIDAVNFLKFVNKNFLIKKIEHATHLVPFERPEATATLILEILSEKL